MSQKKNEGILFPTEIRVVGSYTDRLLSNDLGKKGSNFFCYGEIRFPYVGMLSFSQRECTNQQKAVYEIKCN